MSAGYLRELTLYTLVNGTTLRKSRKVVQCMAKPRREAEASELVLPRESVFFPHSRFLLLWSALLLTALVYQTMTIPFFITFDANDTVFTLTLDSLCSVVFLLDVAVGFNTSFYRKGELVYTRKEISNRYIRTWLLLDILSAPPFYLTIPNNWDDRYFTLDICSLLRSLRLLRVLKLRCILSTFSLHLSNPKHSALFSTFLLVLGVVHLGHWVACGFYYSAFWAPTYKSWLFLKTNPDSSNVERYVAALVWTVSTLTTTGYGDIAPCSIPEKIYGIVIMLLSLGAFSYFVGKISANVLAVDRSEAQHREMRIAINRYLSHTAVPKSTLNRALRHLEYGWYSREENLRLDSQILDQFSEPLRNEICEHIFGKVLGKVKMFRMFEEAVIRKLSRRIQVEVFAPEDVVLKENESSNEMYFLEKGTVDVHHQQTLHTFAVLQVKNTQPGQHFGELGFFCGCLRTASVRCIGFCDILKLGRDALLEVLPLSPSSMNAFRAIQTFFQTKDFKQLGVKCYLCEESTHLARDCDYGKVRLNREMLRIRWLRRRSSTIIDTDQCKVCFRRRKRKVKAAKRYCMRNVKTYGSWYHLKGAGYALTRHVSGSTRIATKRDEDQSDDDFFEKPISNPSASRASSVQGTDSFSGDDELPTMARSTPVPAFTNLPVRGIRGRGKRASRA